MPSFYNTTASSTAVSVSSVDQKWAKELYGSSVKFFFKFESVPVVDNVTGRRATIISDSSANRPFLEEGAFGQALRLRPQSVIQYNTTMPTTLKEFSVGFWLKSVNVSPAVNISTGELNYYRLALLDKSTFEEDGENTVPVDDDETFVIYEECLEDAKNRLVINLSGTTGDKFNFVTDAYSTGEFHHIWIAYSGVAQILNVYIDGKLVDTTADDGIPDELQVNMSVPFHINKSALGYSSLLRGNFGLIDELVFQTEFVQSGEVLSRHINYGSEYAIDNSLLFREEVGQAFAYDDPTTIDILTICSNGANIYAGRTDGKLLKGDRTMWSVRRDFANRDEIRFVKKNILASDYVVSVEDGALKLFKASVRI
jgi:hypothetical protein